jgi:hypothetical protein
MVCGRNANFKKDKQKIVAVQDRTGDLQCVKQT